MLINYYSNKSNQLRDVQSKPCHLLRFTVPR